MKKITAIIMAIFFTGFALWKCTSPESVKTESAISKLPQDVCKTCIVDQDSFKTWFASKQVSLDGMVTPANSVGMIHNNNCDFYKWSERMFLWITSMSNGDTVLASPIFYNVSPPDSLGNRTLIANKPGVPLQMTSHIAKFGPNRLPVLVDNKGKLFEIQKPTEAQNKVKDANGNEVTIDHVEAKGNHLFSFVAKSGKVVEHPLAIINHQKTPKNIVQKFKTNKGFVFLDGEGNVVESEEGQATGDALRAQNGSLVYYLSTVNDVYAAYLSLAKSNPTYRNQFPTTQTELAAITAFAHKNNMPLIDSNTLAIELKSSWIEASSLPNPSDYIIIKATITTYDTSNKYKWIPNGTKTVDMAMVGLHIAGSVAGHPEMVWATFEHQNNTPNAAYRYVDVNKTVKTVPQETGTGWLFTANSADAPYNNPHITSVDTAINGSGNTDTLFSKNGFAISASNTLRTMPWGSAMDSVTNNEDKSDAASNSEVISINNTIQNMLAKGDRRKNYLFIGATWTNNGAPANGQSYGADTSSGVAIGTSRLANSTMETYFQTTATSCLTCHSAFTVPVLTPDTISHIFAGLKPLVTGFAAKK